MPIDKVTLDYGEFTLTVKFVKPTQNILINHIATDLESKQTLKHSNKLHITQYDVKQAEICSTTVPSIELDNRP